MLQPILLSFQVVWNTGYLLTRKIQLRQIRGVHPYLTRRDVPPKRVSFCGKNHATGCPFLTKIMRQGIVIRKKIMPQGIMQIGKLCDRVSQAKVESGKRRVLTLCFRRTYPGIDPIWTHHNAFWFARQMLSDSSFVFPMKNCARFSWLTCVCFFNVQ